MSIMKSTAQAIGSSEGIDPRLRALLDHVAAELAEEHIRLMEAAARADAVAGKSVAGA
jgi:hypothetical protein